MGTLILGVGGALVLLLVVWRTGYRRGQDAAALPWSLCASCATRTRKSAVKQLFVEVWGTDGVLRAKWPVRVQGGPYSDEHSIVLDAPHGAVLLADQITERVTDIARRQAL